MRILTFALLVFSFTLTACDSNDADDAFYEDAAGTYILQTVDDQNLPVDLPREGVTVTDGNIRLNSNKTFSFTITVVEDGQTESETDTGDYELEGDDIYFDNGEDEEEHGSLSGDTLIFITQSHKLELIR